MYLINIHTMNVFFKESYECIYTHWNFKKQMSYRINTNKKHSYGKIFLQFGSIVMYLSF